jgi:hypothetical protein
MLQYQQLIIYILNCKIGMNQQHNQNQSKNTHPAPMPSATVPPARGMDADKEGGNAKVVVSFLLGVAIGGAGMWFAAGDGGSVPADTDTTVEEGDNMETMETVAGTLLDGSTPISDLGASTVPLEKLPDGTGASVIVKDQVAGDKVVLDSVTFGVGGGWVVVHETEGQWLGRALGARRFDAGSAKGEVSLLRNTAEGKVFQVMLYADNGDKQFSLETDKPLVVDGKAVGATFTATSAGTVGVE